MLSLLLLACSGNDGAGTAGEVADYTLNLVPVVPLDGNPFDGVTRVDVLLDNGMGDPVRVTVDAPKSGDSAVAAKLPALEGTQLVVEGYADGELVAVGRSAPITASTGSVDATIFVSRPGEMGQLGTLEPAALGAGAALGDGRFVYLGGIGNRSNGVLGGATDSLRLLDLENPDASLLFEEVGTLPAYTDAEGDEQTKRLEFTMTRLTTGDAGQYLVVGGTPERSYGDSTRITSDVRLFDPDSLTFGDALPSKDSLDTSRAGHVAIANQQGGVLVWGGYSAVPTSRQLVMQTGGELYDPADRSFSVVNAEAGAVGVGLADLGADGTLVAGGAGLDDDSLWIVSDSCFRVSLRGDVEEYSGMSPMAGQAMVGLGDGDVLSFGGVTGAGALEQNISRDAEKTVWRFRHGSHRWEEVGEMKLARVAHTATLLDDQHVLIAGGNSAWTPFFFDDSAISCVELYDTVENTSTMLGDCNAADDAGGLPNRAAGLSAIHDPDLGVLFIGGVDGSNGAVGAVSLYTLP